MLEQLFSSKTRVKLLRLFLNNPYEPYYLREIARELKSQLNSIRREVNNLEKIGILKSAKLTAEDLKQRKAKTVKKDRGGIKKYFLTDTDFILYPELKALMMKAELLLEKNFISKVEKLAKPKLFILTGIFVGNDDFPTDMLIVGNINKGKLSKLVTDFEKELSRSVNFTVMSHNEFKYRHDITDRFLYDILEGQKIVIVDKYNRV